MSTNDTGRRLTGDEYMEVLLQRQAAYVAEHANDRWVPRGLPLLEWLIRPGDEDMVDLPESEPKPASAPRRYRPAASLRAERDRLIERRLLLGREWSDDPATARLGARLVRRNHERMDRDLQKWTALTQRIDALGHRIARAEAREASAER